MPARTITIRGVADATLARLRARAEANRRSLNSELLEVLDRAAASASASGEDLPAAGYPAVREPSPVYATAEPDLLSQVDAQAVAEVCRRHDIAWLAVFGSHARGDARPDSDVDVVVEFEPGRTPGLGIVRVADALREVFGGRRVDLFTRRGLSSRLRGRIESSARTLHGTE